MIDFYTWTTPNGYKPAILLEELGLEYKLHPVDIGSGKQHDPAFLKVNPNGKIPAIVDEPGTPQAITVFESGAILIYLAEKAGKFLPTSGQARADTLAWLMFQMGGIGPMFGQYGHFTMAAPEKVPYAIERYKKEAERLCKVLDGRLGEAEYLAGEYSIADIATYPWVSAIDRFGFDKESIPNVTRWLAAVKARPAVERAYALEIKKS